jgi:hypothetical protein
MRRCWPALVVAVALLPSARLAWELRDMPHLGQYYDDTIYWVTAKALAEGSGYRILSLPDQPYQTKYPPLYPALLAVVWKWFPSFPDNLRPAMLVAWLMLPLYVLAGRWVLVDLGLSRRCSWLLAPALALSSTTMLMSVTLMTDLPFCVLLFAALHGLGRAGGGERGTRWAALAGALGGLAYLTRSAALPLVFTGPLWLVWRRRRREALALLLAMLPAVAGWGLWCRTHRAASTDLALVYYTDYIGYQLLNLSWSSLPSLIGKNLELALAGVSAALTSQSGGSGPAVFFWRLFAFAAVAGTVRLWRTAPSTAYPCFAAGLFSLVVFCTWPPDARSMAPLLPLLAAGLYREIQHLLALLGASARRADRIGRVTTALAGAALVCSGGAWVYQNGHMILRYMPRALGQFREFLPERQAAYEWIARHTPPGAGFVAYGDALLHLYAARPAWSLRVSPRLYYEYGMDRFLEQHGAVEEFARQRRLRYAFLTSGDCYPDEIPEGARQRIRRSLEERFAARRVYRSRTISIFDFGETVSISGGLFTPRRPGVR